MPASKAKVIEKLSAVNGLGEAYATKAYEDLGVRNLDDLVQAAKDNELQSIKGIGAAKEKSILESATELLGATEEPAPAPEDKPKKEEPKKEAKKEEPKAKKEAPKAKKEAPKSNGPRRQRTTYRPPTQSKKRPSIPGLLFKLGKKIIGRILG